MPARRGNVGDLFGPTRPGVVDDLEPAAELTQLILTIAFHPDVDRIGERTVLFVRDDDPVLLCRTEPLFGELPIADPFVSRTGLTLSKRADGIAIHNAHGVENARVDGESVDGEVVLSESLARGAVLELGGRVVLVLERSTPEPDSDDALGLVGGTPAIERVRRKVRSVADLDGPVLIRGATGTGKELVARALHDCGPRRDGPFVAVNMSAIPTTVAASELFGHMKGAFSGADTDHAGYFGRAEGGTIFLDEIGETPPDIQPMLLRFLESSEVQPLGAADPKPVDVRVVAATDADLEAMIERGDYREPLFFRLSSLQIDLPLLCERRADIGRLLVHFLERYLADTGEHDKLRGQTEAPSLWFPAALAARFVRAAWPGNVRQLANVARQVVVESRGLPRVRVDASLERALGGFATIEAAASSAPAGGGLRERMRTYEIEQIEEALRACDYNKPKAAECLEVPYRTLVYKIKTLGIPDEAA